MTYVQTPPGYKMHVHVLSCSVSAFSSWMACPDCGLGHRTGGALCSVCRAVERIRTLCKGGTLLRSQEAAALLILRTAVGDLQDLAELAAPVLEAESRAANPLPQTGSGEAPDVRAKVEVEHPPSPSTSAPEIPPGDFDVKPKEEHVEEKEPVELVRETKEKKQETERDKEEKPKKLKKRKHKSGPSRKKEKARREKKESRSSKAAGAGSTGVDLSDPATSTEVKDQVVARHPSQYNLRPAPKGTVVKHFAHYDLPPPPPAPKRPRSPDHPPPARRGWEADRGDRRHRRERSRSIERAPARKRGTKGVKHRERGRYWPRRR